LQFGLRRAIVGALRLDRDLYGHHLGHAGPAVRRRRAMPCGIVQLALRSCHGGRLSAWQLPDGRPRWPAVRRCGVRFLLRVLQRSWPLAKPADLRADGQHRLQVTEWRRAASQLGGNMFAGRI
jgi:hypothetical protein